METIELRDANFSFFENEYGYKFLIVESEKIEDQIEYCKKNSIENFFISWYKGYYFDTVDFLNRVKAKRIIVNIFRIRSLSAVKNQRELECLVIDSDPVNSELDFEIFPKLEVFKGFWTRNLKNLFVRRSLKVLWLWKYKSINGDLRELAGLENLEELYIIQSNIKSCKGLEKLKRLRKILLGYNRNLETFTDVKPAYQIDEIEVQVCKKLDLTTFQGTDKLTRLKIVNNGKIASLEAIIKHLPALEELQFTEGELTNSNNLYLLRHPKLKHVWLSDKRHYLLKSKEINEALQDSEKRKSILKQHS